MVKRYTDTYHDGMRDENDNPPPWPGHESYVRSFDYDTLAAELADYKSTLHATRLRSEECGNRITALEARVKELEAKIAEYERRDEDRSYERRTRS